MTGSERKQYGKKVERINRKFEGRWQRPFEKIFQSKATATAQRVKAEGVQEAINYLYRNPAIPLLEPNLKRLHREVGITHAKRVWDDLNDEPKVKKNILSLIWVKRSGRLGYNEEWIQFINDYLERDYISKAVLQITQNNRDKLVAVMMQGVRDGMGSDEIYRLLQDWTAKRYIAARVVRTEINRGANVGTMAGASTFKFEQQKEWIAAKDNRTRGNPVNGVKDHANHWSLDGTKIDFEEAFIDSRNGDHLMFPGDPQASAASVINCRCTVAPVAKRDANGRLIPKQGGITISPTRRVPKLPPLPQRPVEPVPDVFRPARNIKEANEYAKKVLKAEFADYSGLELDLANEMNRVVTKIKTALPDVRTKGLGSAQKANKALKDKIEEAYKKGSYYQTIVDKYGGVAVADRAAKKYANNSVRKLGPNTLAWSTVQETYRIPGGPPVDATEFLGVFYNEKYGKRSLIDASVVAGQKSKWFVQSAKDSEYIIHHEFGHEMDKTVNFKTSERFLAIFNQNKASVIGEEELTNRLSRYGATAGRKPTHVDVEMIAEGWAEYITTSTPRPLANQIGEAMMREYYERYVQGTGTTFIKWFEETIKLLRK